MNGGHPRPASCRTEFAREGAGGAGGPQDDSDDNPLREISTRLSQCCPVINNTINGKSYALGWARHILPSSHLGWQNGPQTTQILGRESRPRVLFYHGGQITGYLNSAYMFPETRSAVIVLTNAQGSGDFSDWVAQCLIQELFDLRPRLDFKAIVDENAKIHLGNFQKLKRSLRDTERAGPMPPTRSVVGTYRNDSIAMTIDIFEGDSGLLLMQFNEMESQRHVLTHYHDDVFGFLPAS